MWGAGLKHESCKCHNLHYSTCWDEALGPHKARHWNDHIRTVCHVIFKAKKSAVLLATAGLCTVAPLPKEGYSRRNHFRLHSRDIHADSPLSTNRSQPNWLNAFLRETKLLAQLTVIALILTLNPEIWLQHSASRFLTAVIEVCLDSSGYRNCTRPLV